MAEEIGQSGERTDEEKSSLCMGVSGESRSDDFPVRADGGRPDGGSKMNQSDDDRGGDEADARVVGDGEVTVPVSVVNGLDTMSRRILEVLEDGGGVANSTRIRVTLGLDDTDPLQYRRREHLEPAGLVETEYPDRELEPGVSPPLQWELTEQGEVALEHLNREVSSWEEVPERVEMLESELNRVREVAQKAATRSTGQSETDTMGGAGDVEAETGPGVDETELATVEDRLDEMEQEIATLRESVESIEEEPFFDEDFRHQLDQIMILTAVFKELLLPEYDHDKVQELSIEKRDSLTLLENKLEF